MDNRTGEQPGENKKCCGKNTIEQAEHCNIHPNMITVVHSVGLEIGLISHIGRLIFQRGAGIMKGNPDKSSYRHHHTTIPTTTHTK